MKNRSKKGEVQSIVDDNGIELMINYDFEISASQIEEGHGYHEVGGLVHIDINSVEVVIGGVGVDITHLLQANQIEFIKSKLVIE